LVPGTVAHPPFSIISRRVEDPIGIIKRVFGFAKVRYRGSKRTLIASSSPARSPISSSYAGIYCAAMWRSLSGLATTGCDAPDVTPIRHRYSQTATAAAISMAGIYLQPLVQTFFK
jgi:hypothetical protein